MLGAGSIGSQCITSLVREGAFDKLTLVDDDLFAPHNLARHSLRGSALGMLKVAHLSHELNEIRADLSVDTIAEKLGSRQPSDALASALQGSDRILDMTASLGASRTLCAMPTRSRATSAFFNPTGTSVALLHEDANSVMDLATLEALYYAEIVRNTSLHEHLRPGDEAVVSGGQCRSVTSRIPASRAAVLSSIAANELGDLLRCSDPAIIIASIEENGASHMHRTQLERERSRIDADGWSIGLAETVARRLQSLRQDKLPNETGGILLGVVDHARKRIEVSIGLEAPPDGIAKLFDVRCKGLSPSWLCDHFSCIVVPQTESVCS